MGRILARGYAYDYVFRKHETLLMLELFNSIQ